MHRIDTDAIAVRNRNSSTARDVSLTSAARSTRLR
jgi:hypothetical protein